MNWLKRITATFLLIVLLLAVTAGRDVLWGSVIGLYAIAVIVLLVARALRRLARTAAKIRLPKRMPKRPHLEIKSKAQLYQELRQEYDNDLRIIDTLNLTPEEKRIVQGSREDRFHGQVEGLLG